MCPKIKYTPQGKKTLEAPPLEGKINFQAFARISLLFLAKVLTISRGAGQRSGAPRMRVAVADVKAVAVAAAVHVAAAVAVATRFSGRQ